MRTSFAALVVVALCTLAGGMVFAETDPSVDARLKEGIRLHDAARIDPEANLARGKEILSSIRDRSPVAKAYYGSIITLEAGECAKKKNGLAALALLNEGTGIIDDAVKSAPDVPDIHFLRMINSYEVSQASPLNRFKVMKKDIDWLEPRKASFSAEQQASVDLYKGLYLAKARKIDGALSAFRACVAVAPGTPEAAEAQKQLDRYAE